MKRFIDIRFVRFILFGGFNTLTGYVIYLVCLKWMTFPLAFTASTITGILIAYSMNALFVFRVRMAWKDFLRYPLVYLVQYVVGLLLLFLEIRVFGLSERWAPLLNVAMMVPFTYFMNRLVLMRGGANA